MATGTNSTESPMPPGLPTTPEQAAQDALSWRQGLKRLLAMEAIDSFTRSFAWEREQVAIDNQLVNGALSGNGNLPATSSGGEAEMLRNMVAGNMWTVNNNYNGLQPTQEK